MDLGASLEERHEELQVCVKGLSKDCRCCTGLIISRTPFRLTLGGGGTDLPSYYSRFGGFVVSSAIDKYVYLVAKRRFEEEVRVSYSITEIVNGVDRIQHPIVREALRLLGIRDHLEIVSIADAPSKTGLGSSGSFTVGLLHALHMYSGKNPSSQELAEEACRINMEILKRPSGKQDEYVSAFGGFVCLNIGRDGRVEVSPLRIRADAVSELENNLLFFYTGIKRKASDVLHCQKGAVERDEARVVEAMHRIKEIGFRVRRALERGDITEFGKLQHEHWLAKRSVSPKMSNPLIDRWYGIGLKSGALGGKIMGAGGGGFLMFYCEEGRDRVRKAMAMEGLEEVRFRLGSEGSKIIINL